MMSNSKNKTLKKRPIRHSKREEDVDEGKLCAILGYIFPIGLLWYLLDNNLKDNSFVKHHVYQGLVLTITCFILQFVLLTFTGVFGFMNVIFIPVILGILIQLSLLALFIIGLVYAIKGEYKSLPVIGEFAKHMNF
jgi:uncharacterized membrane protein